MNWYQLKAQQKLDESKALKADGKLKEAAKAFTEYENYRDWSV